MEGLVRHMTDQFMRATMNERLSYTVLATVFIAWVLVLCLPCILDAIMYIGQCVANGPSGRIVGIITGTMAFVLTPVVAVVFLELFLDATMRVGDDSYLVLPVQAYEEATWTQLWHMNLNLILLPLQYPVPSRGNVTAWFTLYRNQSLCLMDTLWPEARPQWCFWQF